MIEMEGYDGGVGGVQYILIWMDSAVDGGPCLGGLYGIIGLV